MAGLMQRIFPGTNVDRFAPPGLLDNASPEERQRLQRQTTQTLGAGLASGNALAGQQMARGLLDTEMQNNQAQQANQQWGQFVASKPGLTDSQRFLLTQMGPEAGSELLTSRTSLSAGQGLYNEFTGNRLNAQPTTQVQDTMFRNTDPQARADYEAEQAQAGQFSLGAGQQRFDAQGNPVAERATTAQQDRDAGVRGEGEDVRERKIQALVGQGVDRGRAERLTDGLERIEIVPQTGMARLVDSVGSTVEEIPLGSLSSGEREMAAEAADTEGAVADDALGPPPAMTLWEAAGDGTGAFSTARSGLSSLSGQVGGPIASNTVRARALMENETQNLVRAMVNNPRFPVAEMERVIKNSGLTPSVTTPPSVMRENMRALNTYLTERMKVAQRDSSNPNLPQDMRAAQAQNASLIESFLPRLGVPAEEGQGSRQVVEPLDDEIEAILRKYEQ